MPPKQLTLNAWVDAVRYAHESAPKVCNRCAKPKPGRAFHVIRQVRLGKFRRQRTSTFLSSRCKDCIAIVAAARRNKRT